MIGSSSSNLSRRPVASSLDLTLPGPSLRLQQNTARDIERPSYMFYFRERQETFAFLSTKMPHHAPATASDAEIRDCSIHRTSTCAREFEEGL